ncbi:MAG: hypothetical protein QM286_12990 [Acidobacteriota bacterium]|nr:hypothetical protein [Acidobacteriota bacterium]
MCNAAFAGFSFAHGDHEVVAEDLCVCEARNGPEEGSDMAMNPLGFRTVVGCTLVGLLLAGCGTANSNESPSQPPTPLSSTSSPGLSPSASQTPTLSAGEQAAVDAAEAALTLYDQIAADPTADIEQLTTVARDSAYLTWARRLAEYRAQGWVKTGTSVRHLEATSPGTDARQWIVAFCIDSAGVDVVDAAGNSVVDQSAPSRSMGSYTVTQDPTMFGWFVTSYEVSGTC